MRTEIIIKEIFCKVANCLKDIDFKHSQSKLKISQIVAIGVLKSLSMYSFRRFYEWFKQFNLFPLNERSRLQRLINKYWKYAVIFLKKETVLNIADSYAVELIHPRRYGRKEQLNKIVRKGKSNGRWMVGRKIGIVINNLLQIVCFNHDLAGGTDKVFNKDFEKINGIILADSGYNDKDKSKIPKNLKLCKKDSWNDRMYIESLFSLWKRMLNTKQMTIKTLNGFSARTAYLCALTNILFDLNIKFGYNRFSMKQWTL
jgi:hypothetical protein